GSYAGLPLRTVPEGGGATSIFPEVADSKGSRFPQLLLNNRLMYFVLNGAEATKSTAYVLSLGKPGAPFPLMTIPLSPVFASGAAGTDYVLWRRGTALVAQAADRTTFQLRGPVAPVA